MTTLAHSPANDTRMTDLMSDVREFGRSLAAGKDSLPMLAVRVVRAANDGVISTEKDKDGTDDATRIYTEVMKSASKKAIHEHTAGGIKANASKLRQLIIMGAMTTCDPVDVLNRAIVARGQMVEADQKVRPAYPAYIEVARAQLEQPDALSDEQITGAMLKPEREDKTAEDVLNGVLKTLDKLISGEIPGGAKDQDERVIAAHSSIKDRLAALCVQRETDETLAKAAELGLHIVQPTPAADSTLIAA